MRTGLAVFVLLGAALSGLAVCSTQARSAERVPNKVAGTWTMVSARIDPDGRNQPAYGPKPSGMLVFTEDMHFVEVLTDSTVPKFASNVRGDGTDEENRKAMTGSIGFFGRYTVDGHGEFSGNRVEGSTFPNWIGDIRTRKELRLTMEGSRMTEAFQRPDGTRIAIVYERAR